MLISKAQRHELIEDQPKTKQRKMSQWVIHNSHSIHHTWEALLEMDDLAFRNLRTIVELVAKERNETE